MSQRNEYEIHLKHEYQLEQIIESLEQTGIVVEASSSPTNDTRTIIAEDAPAVGESFAPHIDPGEYIRWSSIRNALKPYAESIERVEHKCSSDTSCQTTIKTFVVENGEFIQTNEKTLPL